MFLLLKIENSFKRVGIPKLITSLRDYFIFTSFNFVLLLCLRFTFISLHFYRIQIILHLIQSIGPGAFSLFWISDTTLAKWGLLTPTKVLPQIFPSEDCVAASFVTSDNFQNKDWDQHPNALSVHETHSVVKPFHLSLARKALILLHPFTCEFLYRQYHPCSLSFCVI